jgi:hypothetical protein
MSTAAAKPAVSAVPIVGAPLPPPAPLGVDPLWKKDFKTLDLTLAMFMGTAFLFLSIVNYSFDQFVWDQLTPGNAAVDNRLVQALATFYTWRLSGTPIIKWFEILVACILPLIFFALIVANVETVQGKRAPIGRHILDAESLFQIIAVIYLTVAHAMPTTNKLIAMVDGTSGEKVTSGEVYAEVTNLLNYHFVIMMLNILQWFVPLLRLVYQRKQDGIRQREANVAAALAQRAAEKAEKAAAKAAKNALPSAEEMAKRMTQAEGIMQTEDEPSASSEIKKRHVAAK